ncbi:hypothetical protein SNEBB_005779 [Seison nebaliae]|nr:hypothetical protein SNEBB_005779 [Seison nebaliae]
MNRLVYSFERCGVSPSKRMMGDTFDRLSWQKCWNNWFNEHRLNIENKTPSIIYNNHQILAINKPSTMPIYPGNNKLNDKKSLVEWMMSNPLLRQHQNHSLDFKFFTCHRLDICTSGIILVPLNKDVCRTISTSLNNKEKCEKCYDAIVFGHLNERELLKKNSCEINRINDNEFLITHQQVRDPIHRYKWKIYDENDDGYSSQFIKESFMKIQQINLIHQMKHSMNLLKGRNRPKTCQTIISLIKKGNLVRLYDNHQFDVTFVRLKPITGRQHQLRVMLSELLRHPIVGDELYAGRNKFAFGRTFLHASSIHLNGLDNIDNLSLNSPPDFYSTNSISIIEQK